MLRLVLVLFFVLRQALCGQIFVDDFRLTYQNKGYIQGFHLYFALESGLGENEFMKIQFPLQMSNTFIPYFLENYDDYTQIEDIDTTGLTSYSQINSDLIFAVSQELEANKWYHLVIIGDISQFPSSYITTPIQVTTQSSSSTTGSVIYDSNRCSGFIQISAQPTTLPFTISLKSDEISLPSSSKTQISEQYQIYIDVTPQANYSKGGVFEVKLQGGFEFLGSCTSKGRSCEEGDTSCQEIEEVESYECRVRGRGLDRFWFDHAGPVVAKKVVRFKVYVKNPRYPVLTEKGIGVKFMSRQSDLIFEAGEMNTGFLVEQLQILVKDIYLFWGLRKYTAINRGCPITIYLTDTILVYNKFRLYFQPRASFPIGNYKLEFNLQYVDLLQTGSVYHNFPRADENQEIECIPNLSDVLMRCYDIGAMQASSVSFIGFAFVVDKSRSGVTFNNFAKSDGSYIQIAVETDPPALNAPLTNADFAGYGVGNNQVFDIASPAYPASADIDGILNPPVPPPSNILSRTAIKYSSQAIDLLVSLRANLEQKCCSVASVYSCPSISTTPYCGAPLTAAQKSSHIMLKILINPNIFDHFSEVDPSDSDYLKGIDILPAGYQWMISKNSMNQLEPCDNPTTYDKFCNSYSHYSTFVEISEKKADGTFVNGLVGGFYNQWTLVTSTNIYEQDYYELQWACISIADQIKTCAVDDTASGEPGSFYYFVNKRKKKGGL